MGGCFRCLRSILISIRILCLAGWGRLNDVLRISERIIKRALNMQTLFLFFSSCIYSMGNRWYCILKDTLALVKKNRMK